jgi:hypothetical protein
MIASDPLRRLKLAKVKSASPALLDSRRGGSNLGGGRRTPPAGVNAFGRDRYVRGGTEALDLGRH